MKFKKSHIAILVILGLLIAAYITRQFIRKKIAPEVIFEEQNLIPNGDIEIPFLLKAVLGKNSSQQLLPISAQSSFG